MIRLPFCLSPNAAHIIETPPAPVSFEGVKDPAHVPVTGEFPLEGFAPRSYEMKMTVAGRVACKSASRRVVFVFE